MVVWSSHGRRTGERSPVRMRSSHQGASGGAPAATARAQQAGGGATTGCAMDGSSAATGKWHLRHGRPAGSNLLAKLALSKRSPGWCWSAGRRDAEGGGAPVVRAAAQFLGPTCLTAHAHWTTATPVRVRAACVQRALPQAFVVALGSVTVFLTADGVAGARVTVGWRALPPVPAGSGRRRRRSMVRCGGRWPVPGGGEA
jgi:hypothetical protein